MLRFAAFACAMVILCPMADAADKSGSYVTWGLGTDSCGTYTTARRDQSDLMYRVWLGGYLTATNIDTPDTVDIGGSTDLNGLLGWLDNYCQTNPTSSFGNAAEALVIFLYPKRQTHRS